MKVRFKFSDKYFDAQQMTPNKIPHGVIKYCGKFILSTNESAPHSQIRVFQNDWVVKIGDKFLHFPPKAFEAVFDVEP